MSQAEKAMVHEQDNENKITGIGKSKAGPFLTAHNLSREELKRGILDNTNREATPDLYTNRQ